MHKHDITNILADFGIEYEVINHNNPSYVCEQVAFERKIKIEQVVKCMIGKDFEKNIYVMMLPGNARLDFKKLRNLNNNKEILLSSKEDLLTLGVTIGAISPIQFLNEAKFFLDKSVLCEKIVDISSGTLYAGIHLKIDDLIKLINPIICDIILTPKVHSCL